MHLFILDVFNPKPQIALFLLVEQVVRFELEFLNVFGAFFAAFA